MAYQKVCNQPYFALSNNKYFPLKQICFVLRGQLSTNLTIKAILNAQFVTASQNQAGVL